MRSQASLPRPRSWIRRIPLAGSGMMLASEVSNARSSLRAFGFLALANVFLHYVLDLWFHRKRCPSVPEGEAIIVRYADDIVVGFQHKRDAER